MFPNQLLYFRMKVNWRIKVFDKDEFIIILAVGCSLSFIAGAVLASVMFFCLTRI